TRFFQLDEVVLEIRFLEVCRGRGRRKHSQTACLKTCGVTRSFTTVAISRTGTRGSSSCAGRAFSTKRPDTFSQTVLVGHISSCTSAADHTCYANYGGFRFGSRRLASAKAVCAPWLSFSRSNDIPRLY